MMLIQVYLLHGNTPPNHHPGKPEFVTFTCMYQDHKRESQHHMKQKMEIKKYAPCIVPKSVQIEFE